MVASLPSPGNEVTRVVVRDAAAYLILDGALWIVDVSDVENPVSVTVFAETDVLEIVEHAGFLYVGASTGLRVYSLQDPLSPTLVTSVPLSLTGSVSLEFVGTILYLNDDSVSLYLIDVSDPSQANLASTMMFSDPINDVIAVDDAVIVGTDGRLHLLDIADLLNPQIVWTSFQAGLEFSRLPDGRVLGNLPLNGVSAIEVRTPTSLWLEHLPDFPSWNAVQVDGDFAFLTRFGPTFTTRTLDVYDVSDLRAPALIGTVQPWGGEDVEVVGDKLYLASHQRGLVIFDVADPRTTLHEEENVGFGAIRSAIVADRYVYATGRAGLNDGLFRVLDATDPTLPEIGRAPRRASSSPEFVAASGELAVTATNRALEAFDVSDPTEPVPVGEFFTSASITGLAVAGEVIYASGSHISSLRLFKSTDGSIAELGPAGTNSLVSLAASGKVLVGVDAAGTLTVFDLADPENPSVLREDIPAPGVTHLHIEGEFLFGKNTASGELLAWSLSDPATPSVLGSVSLLPGGGRMASRAPLLFVTSEEVPGVHGTQVVEFSRNTPPVVRETITTSDPANINGLPRLYELVPLVTDHGYYQLDSREYLEYCGRIPCPIYGGTLQRFPPPCTAVSAPPSTYSSSVVLGVPNPNPFRTASHVAFTMERAGRVTLDVFDVAGRRVTRLLDEERSAGSHTMPWNGRADHGDRVASGTYFVRVALDGVSETRSVVYLR